MLDKSKADWSVHKQEAALEKDLTNHNRSNDRYVDKQVPPPPPSRSCCRVTR